MIISKIQYPQTAYLHKYISKNVWDNRGYKFNCTEITKKTKREYDVLTGLQAIEEFYTIETPETLDFVKNDRIVIDEKTYVIDNVNSDKQFKQAQHTFRNQQIFVYEIGLKRG